MYPVPRGKIIEMLKSRLTEKRLRHSLEVEKEAIKLAARYGQDWHKAALAGLLHDFFRCDDPDWQLEYMRKNSVKLSKEWLKNPQIWHGPCAAVYLRRELGIRDQKILMAVRYHSTCRPGATDFEKVVFLADKIEGNRGHDNVEEIRAAAYRSLNESLYLEMKRNFAYLCKNGLPLVKETYDAYNELTIYLHH